VFINACVLHGDADRFCFAQLVNKVTGRIVQVGGLRCRPEEYLLSMLPGTHTMNFATWEGLYCPFPVLTLERQKMFDLSCGDDRHLAGYERYIGRGFTVVDPDEAFVLDEVKRLRFIGDRYSFREGFSDSQDRPFYKRFRHVGQVRFRVTTNGIELLVKK
jgi:hypothetical protein